MKILVSYGKDELATVWIAEFQGGRMVEFAESVQPPIPREEKWVLLISVSAGCPVKCLMCDAGGDYRGKLSVEEIFEQIDFLVRRRYPAMRIPVPKFKVQFARMGEPAYNNGVLDVIEALPDRYAAPGLMPCVSTIAPEGTDDFFARLLRVRNAKYRGCFQLQFSIHTTDQALRDKLVPVRKWDFPQIGDFGRKYYAGGGRKIGLNFATPLDFPVDAAVIRRHFDPEIFLLKFTPLNPTYKAAINNLKTYIDPDRMEKTYDEIEQLKALGFEVLMSIGENEENLIGSNCGQYITSFLKSGADVKNSYRLDDYEINECEGLKSPKHV